jgi:hypothetical protein
MRRRNQAASAGFSPDASADISDPPGHVPTGRVFILRACLTASVPFTPARQQEENEPVGEKLWLAIRSSKPKT